MYTIGELADQIGSADVKASIFTYADSLPHRIPAEGSLKAKEWKTAYELLYVITEDRMMADLMKKSLGEFVNDEMYGSLDEVMEAANEFLDHAEKCLRVADAVIMK